MCTRSSCTYVVVEFDCQIRENIGTPPCQTYWNGCSRCAHIQPVSTFYLMWYHANQGRWIYNRAKSSGCIETYQRSGLHKHSFDPQDIQQFSILHFPYCIIKSICYKWAKRAKLTVNQSYLSRLFKRLCLVYWCRLSLKIRFSRHVVYERRCLWHCFNVTIPSCL